MAAVPFVDRVPDYEIREGIMHISDGDWSCCMSLRTFRLGMAKAQRTLDEYDARSGVVPLRKGQR